LALTREGDDSVLQVLKSGRSRLAGILSVGLLALAIPLSLIGTAHATVVPSELTIKWKPSSTKFVGHVNSDLDNCLSDRLVKVYKVREGADKRIGHDLTNHSGKWAVDVRHAHGRYYAKVAKTQVGGYYGTADTCGKARSETIRVS
jgi:hypothetical protein